MFRRPDNSRRYSSTFILVLVVICALMMIVIWSRAPSPTQIQQQDATKPILRTFIKQDCSLICEEMLKEAKNNNKASPQLLTDKELEEVPHCSTPLHDPINFEPPQPNSLTGPRKTPLKKHAKSLVTIPVGAKSKATVSAIIKAFGFEHFTFMLFHYDNTDWSDMEWYNDVIAIRYTKQMKWWYIKRFVSPQVAETYEYIFCIDEDSGMEFMDVPAFIDILRTHNISIAQPAMHEKSNLVSHEITRQVAHTDPSIVGRWTDMAECGPFIVFSSEAYTDCIWDLIQEDLTSGWGLDHLWHGYCKKRTGRQATAIIDKYPQVHLSFQTATTGGGNPNKPKYNPSIEMGTYFQRFPQVKRTQMKVFGMIRMP